ncbi:Crp/Fnr family transcriptional regulator [Chitinophaga caseinilytica]|uniref:Crp/Fnr family transcriptional regulator n=1 Tax=Chitinophaga caseinilytica TaxID=2267521 RepID=A0ABZ2Z8H2_9BACT
MEQLFAHLSQYHPISDAARQAAAACFREEVHAKNDMLITQGQVCRRLYFVEKGCLRGYYHLEDKEVTHWFGFERDFVTSFHSFTTGQPAVENIQLMEGAVLWSVSREDLLRLLDTYHELERLVRIAYEKYYLRLEERYVNSQFRTAAERYEQLLEQAPHILERAPLGYVASYLGISQETLSRVRGRI